jgi:MFS transporter, YNFM family, putative membrane transport protein
VLIAGFFEGALAWGAFAYIGAYLRLRFGLSYSAIGGIVACFGIGGLIYAALVKLLVHRMGQTGLAVAGGVVLGIAYLQLAIGSIWWLAPAATTAIGLGFYMLHNTLQTNATQMTPQARGTAVGLFSSALYIGQTAGVGAGALVIDRAGARPLFLTVAAALPALAVWFVRELKRYRRTV